jgi:hypothetical protein
MTETVSSPYVRNPNAFRVEVIDAYMAVVPADVQQKVREFPLTDDQVGVLTSLVEHGSGDFMWSNRSTTNRLLDALAKKGLAVATQGLRHGRAHTFYAPLPEIRAVYRARKDAQDAEQSARWAAEARARHEAALEALNTSKALANTLDVALRLLADEKSDPVHPALSNTVSLEALTAARNHVAALQEQNEKTEARLNS